MSYKILTKNGIDNSNIDGARGEYFNSGMRDGIVQGALNEGTFTATASNIISLDTCELRIAGHRIVIDEPVYHTFTNAPSTDTRYAFVAQIVVDANQNVDFSLFVQTANTPLIQNDLYKTIIGAGTYQIEIGRFTLLTSLAIEDVVRTIDVITGGIGGGSGSEINIGTVTTHTLDSNVDAEVDVSSRYEEDEGKEYLDFTFGIPKAEVNVDDELSETSENPVQNKIITSAMNDITNNITVISNSNGGFIAGMGATATQGSSGGVVIGKLAIDNSSSDKSIAIGRTANAGVNGGIAIGSGSQANNSGIALGSSATATGTNSIQLGEGSNSTPNTLQVYDDNIYDANTHTLKVENAEIDGKPVATINTATQNHATSGVQVGWYQVANLKTQGNYDVKIKQAYNYNLPEAIHLSISINNRLSTVEPFASITQLSGVNPGAFSLSKIRVRQGTDEGTTFLDVYSPDQLWNSTWVDITSDSRDVVVETNSPFQFIGTEDNPSGYKISSLDLVTGFNTSYLNVSDTVTFSGRVSDLNTISQPVNSTVTYTFGGGCANAPTTDSGMVIQYQESTAYCTQLVIANDADASTWRRSYRDGTWTEWTKVGTFLQYEYNKAISFGESGYLYIGKFPIYDTNITVDISSTTSTTYSGKLVIACQNYVVLKASVFGDYSNTVTPNIYYRKVDNTVEIYFKPTAWSKNVIHITGCGIRGEVTHVCENISTIPSDATLQPENEYVESGQTGAGQTELIYDMDSTDASINHGYPNGLVGGRTVEIDYSKYKKLRIYAQAKINNQSSGLLSSSTEFNIDGDFADNTLTISDAVGNYVFFLHIRATKAQNRVALFYTMKITNNNGTITAEKIYADDSVILTKIEGLY